MEPSKTGPSSIRKSSYSSVSVTTACCPPLGGPMATHSSTAYPPLSRPIAEWQVANYNAACWVRSIDSVPHLSPRWRSCPNASATIASLSLGLSSMLEPEP